MRRLARTLAVSAALFAGCQADYDLDWGVVVPPGLDAEVVSLHALIQLDGCASGDRVEYLHRLRPPSATTDVPPELDDGRYCFRAVAEDAACRLIASAERIVELPLDAGEPLRFDLVLARVPSAIDCPAACSPAGCAGCGAGDVVCMGPMRCCPGILGTNACALGVDACEDPGPVLR